MKLDPRATAAGVCVISHDVLDSTNAEALRLARRSVRGPLWITAGRQSAGRGRRGRTWISEPGNLHASLLLTVPAAIERWPQLSFVAALAMFDAVAEVAADLVPHLAIKWPNDLLLRGEKLAGSLIEGHAGGTGGEGAVVIGIGMNCGQHPTDTEHPAINLAGAGAHVSPATLFAALAAAMVGRLAQWNRGEGFSNVRADWLAHACGLGEDIRVRLIDREIAGRFDALDDAGGLLLRLPDGDTVTIGAGEIFMLPAGLPVTAN